MQELLLMCWELRSLMCEPGWTCQSWFRLTRALDWSGLHKDIRTRIRWHFGNLALIGALCNSRQPTHDPKCDIRSRLNFCNCIHIWLQGAKFSLTLAVSDFPTPSPLPPSPPLLPFLILHPPAHILHFYNSWPCNPEPTTLRVDEPCQGSCC